MLYSVIGVIHGSERRWNNSRIESKPSKSNRGLESIRCHSKPREKSIIIIIIINCLCQLRSQENLGKWSTESEENSNQGNDKDDRPSGKMFINNR